MLEQLLIDLTALSTVFALLFELWQYFHERE